MWFRGIAAAWLVSTAAAPALAQEAAPPRDTWGTENPLPAPAAAAEAAAPAPTLPCDPCETDAAERVPLKYTLERIEVRGNGKTSTRVVLRYIPFSEGDVIDVD